MTRPRDPWGVASSVTILTAALLAWPAVGRAAPVGGESASAVDELGSPGPVPGPEAEVIDGSRRSWRGLKGAARGWRAFEDTAHRLMQPLGAWTVHAHSGFSMGIPGAAAMLMGDLVLSGPEAACRTHLNGSVGVDAPFWGATVFVREPPLTQAEQEARANEEPPRTALGRLWRGVKHRGYTGPILGFWGVSTEHSLHGTPFTWVFIPHVGGITLGRNGNRGMIGLIWVVNPLSVLSPYVGLNVSHPWILSGPEFVRKATKWAIAQNELITERIVAYCKERYASAKEGWQACRSKVSGAVCRARASWRSASHRETGLGRNPAYAGAH